MMSYKKSEVRLIEIQEKLCKDIERGQKQVGYVYTNYCLCYYICLYVLVLYASIYAIKSHKTAIIVV